jgi:alpha-L-rhamnosidase
MSQILEKTSDITIYSTLYTQLAEEFHRVFFNNTSKFYADGMQAAQVLALALPDVVPTNVRGAVVDYLAADISKKGNHVSTGIVSNAQIYPVLSDNGHHDLALELVSSTTYPSYGYMFNNPYDNATTVWELWDSSLEGPSMNSRNHHMYSSVGAWFYSHVAGIDLTSDIITIRPRMASEDKKHLMKKLDCQLSTLYGIIHVSYTRDERDTIANSILLRVTIPPNAQARVMFEPLFTGGQCITLMEGNKVIWSSDIVNTNHREFVVEKEPESGLMSVHVGSGQYEFQAMWK